MEVSCYITSRVVPLVGPWKFHATSLAEWCHWLDLAIGQGYQLGSAIVPAWVWSQAVVHQDLRTGCYKPRPSSPSLIPSGQALQIPPVSSMIQDHTTLGELDLHLGLSSHWRKCRLRLALMVWLCEASGKGNMDGV